MASYRTRDILKKDMTKTIRELLKRREELQRSNERYRIVAETTKDIIWEGDLINRKRFFSGNLYEILGYEPTELEDLDKWFSIIHPEDICFVSEGIRNQISEGIDVKTFEYRVRSKSGSYKWISSNTKCEFNHRGEAISSFGSFTDITELKEQQQRIHTLAYYDSITELPNRVMLSQIDAERIDEAAKNSSKFAMVFMDLDNFKYINDSYGHLVGDQLLLEVGKRLREINNDKITAFRLGGDEFILLIENVDNLDEVEQLSSFLNEVVEDPFFVDGHMFYVTHSGGIVLYPENGNTFEELLKNADTAMYRSKESGKATNSFYHAKMGEAAIEKAEIEADLHRALKNNEFVLYYQPIVNVDDGKIKGCEALIRWIHPKRGMVSPEKFINIAEKNGTIIKIGKWVFESACKYAKSMHDNGYDDFYVSVNISPQQLLDKSFTDFVISTINKTGVDPEKLVIEITESVFIESMDSAINKLKELKDLNIKIALDDFGCGYSSLTYLKLLPINIVKVDRSFIDDIKSEDDAKNMTNIIILMARQLGLNVIAEGVEAAHHLNYLKKHGCDMFQGYLISKPVPPMDVVDLINHKNNCIMN